MTSPDGTRPEPTSADRRSDAIPKRQLSDAERRRLAEVFGDVLPDQTRDEQDLGGAERLATAAGGGRDSERDAEISRNVPPHHG